MVFSFFGGITLNFLLKFTPCGFKARRISTFDVEVLKLDQSHKPLSIEFPLTERTSSTNKML